MTRARKETLLTLGRVWRQREDRIRQGVVAARGEVSSIEARRIRLRAVLDANSQALRAGLDTPGAPGDMTGYRLQAGQIRGEMLRESQRLAAAEQQLASMRVELAGAIKQRRALDRLAQKRAAAGAAEDQWVRQKELDDMHASRDSAARVSVPIEMGGATA